MNLIDKFLRKKTVWPFTRFIFRRLDYVMRKHNNLLIFSSYYGEQYCDNSRYLFEEFIDSHPDLECFWVTANKAVLEMDLEPKIKSRILYQYSLHTMVTVLRARFIFYSYGYSDLPGFEASSKKFRVQLWHGTSIKRMGRSKEGASASTIKAIKKMVLRYYSIWICNSTTQRIQISHAYGLPVERVICTGYPRNDYLLNEIRNKSTLALKRWPFLQNRTILYAPTWRSDTDTKLFPFPDYSRELLLEFLNKHDAYLVIRPHHTESDHIINDPKIEEKPQENRIIVLDHNALTDITEILSHIDILISDYSSIWVDYLLTNRPVILIPYDLEEFKKKQGLHYEIGSISPGPLIQNQKELEMWLERYLLEPSLDNERRQFVRGLFHDHEDAGACNRIADIVRKHMAIHEEHAIVKK